MFGSGMFQALQKKQKDTSKEKENAADRLEASRRRAAAEVAAGREKLRAQREARERVAAATEQALREERERQAAEEKARNAALEEYASLVRKRDPRAASGWYYVDDAGARQGPFASTKMRAWFVDGHLSHDLRVAPVFEEGGKLPGTDIMQRIDEIFDEPLLTSAFRSVARPRPPPNAEKPKPSKRKRDDAPKPTGDWLKDSLARQKKGIHHLRHDRNQGPAMLFESHEA
mmetsp:Transcript_6267/g.15944  ORF Transcript_6267/g.15944 Transcript_6267/m.15944 type:complete len:230 (+) Transcript_6267:76-765(+)